MATATRTRKLRPPIKCHGGKSYLQTKIIPLLPPHRTFSEPFLGGGSVLLNLPRAEREVAAEIDADLANLWNVLKSDYEAVRPRIEATDYTEAEFEAGRRLLQGDDRLVRAVGCLVRNRFSRGGLGKTFAWSERTRGGKPGDANAWDTIRAELPRIVERVRDVEIRCCPATELIEAFDAPDTLVYADPPYHHETRTAKAAYANEMTHEQHADLLDLLCRCRSMVAVSGYRHTLYDEALKGWELHEFDVPNNAGQGKVKQRRIECLWIKR